MKAKDNEKIKSFVLKKYRSVARQGVSSGYNGLTCQGCCSSKEHSSVEIATATGYTQQELEAAPEGANLGLGCGNPQTIADLRSGETVLDLGCGGGFDCFLAADQVGPEGFVIGVDMTPEMISLARNNLAKSGFENVSFRLGEIENLPVTEGSVDVVISNCVINLTSDKRTAYREAFRVLKPGGRLAISDVLATAPIPEEMRQNVELWTSCVSGAAPVDELKDILSEIGFEEIEIEFDQGGQEVMRQCAPGLGVENYVAPAGIVATKPIRQRDRNPR
ncbi:MAG: arsenite methyltransferase [Deltaproteobacteria bacterium]|nr:MAG: arsenite methyltransferase [Deltaproteobacteria bacterium]